MIKFSKLTDYAVVILSTLQNSDKNLLSASTIALRSRLPEPTVSKVLKLLVRADIITSLRGSNGGYALQKSSNSITVYDIAAAIEGPVSLTACVDDSENACDLAHSCAVNGRWDGVNEAVKNALKSVTIANMITPNPFLDDKELKIHKESKRA